MTARRLYHYRLTCDRCLDVSSALGTDEIDAVLEAGWGYRGMAGEVTDCWCPPCAPAAAVSA